MTTVAQPAPELDAQPASTTALRVALLGCGTVGSEVARLIGGQADDLRARIGRPLELVGIAVRRPGRERAGIDPALFTTDAAGLVTRDDVDLVIEVIGGIEPARGLILAALRHGKSVVTANKALLAEDGGTLFAAAERSGFLLPLSEHVQRKALGIVGRWRGEAGRLGVAINVTAADIARAGFAERVSTMIAETGVDPRRVTLEVTEGALIEDLAGAASLLATLRSRGHRIAIDDFGTGYSSLAYLKALPLDLLKIDRRLAQDIAGSARDRVVVTGTIGMARSLGLAVLAEGVETEAQLTALAAEGCTYYQGFLRAPPLTEAALVRLLAREQRSGRRAA